MRASNPLIAVGISAVVLLGTTSAASAQTEPASDAESVNSKESALESTRENHPAEVQAARVDRKQTQASEQPEEKVAESIATPQTSQSAARIEIFVAPDAATQLTPQSKTAQPLDLAQTPAVDPAAPAEPVDSPATNSRATDSSEPATVEAGTAVEEEIVPRSDAAEANAAETTPELNDATGETIDPSDVLPAEVEEAEATEQEASQSLPDSTLPNSIDAAATPELAPDLNEAAENSSETTVETPVDGVAQEPGATEESSPEEEEPGETAEPESEAPVSPATERTSPSEIEQQEEEAENAEPADQPPQDSENILPEDRVPSGSSDETPSDEAPSDEAPTDEAQPTPGEEDEIQPSAPLEDSSVSDPAPDYLDPDANPLFFPTTPEEVQLVGTQPVTLEQAIEAGLRNNEELQTTRLELQRLRASLRETQAEEYPDINADAQLNYAAGEQANSLQDPLTGDIEVDGTAASRTLTLGGTIELSYAVFTSGRRPALIESAERQVRFQELQVESDTEDLILQITNDYYDLQEADEQVQIFRATLEEAQRSLRDAEALERAGVGTRFDVLQAQVDVANAQQNLRSQQSQQEISRRQLAERLNLNQTITLAAADPIEVAGVWDLSLEETIVSAYRNRSELEQQLVQREIAERNRRAALAQLGPQVVFQTSYGLNNTLESEPNSGAEQVGFLSDFRAGLGLSMILFDGGAARAQARQAEANIAIAEANFANQRDQIRFNVEQGYAQLESNYDNIQTTALAVQQAVEALRLARLRFQAGVGTQTDVLQAQTALTQARFNNLQAILNYNRALASLQRQVSNYPEGYLNEVP